jgi:hypothetical protein
MGQRQEKADVGRIFAADDRFLPMLEYRKSCSAMSGIGAHFLFSN